MEIICTLICLAAFILYIKAINKLRNFINYLIETKKDLEMLEDVTECLNKTKTRMKNLEDSFSKLGGGGGSGNGIGEGPPKPPPGPGGP